MSRGLIVAEEHSWAHWICIWMLVDCSIARPRFGHSTLSATKTNRQSVSPTMFSASSLAYWMQSSHTFVSKVTWTGQKYELKGLEGSVEYVELMWAPPLASYDCLFNIDSGSKFQHALRALTCCIEDREASKVVHDIYIYILYILFIYIHER